MSRKPHCLAMLVTHHFQKVQVSHAMDTPLPQHACCTTSQPLVDVMVQSAFKQCRAMSWGWCRRQQNVAALSCMCQQGRPFAT